MVINRKYHFTIIQYGRSGRKSYTIRMRTTYAGERFDVYTGVTIQAKEEWDAENEMVRPWAMSPSGESASSLNERLFGCKRIMDQCISYFAVTDRIPAVEDLRAMFEREYAKSYPNTQKASRKPAGKPHESSEIRKKYVFYEVYDLFMKESGVKNSWTRATYQKFEAVRNDLYSYRPKIAFDEIDDEWLNGFVAHLRGKRVLASRGSGEAKERKVVKKGLKNTTIAKKLSFLTWFLNWATVKGYNKNLAFRTYKPRIKIAKKQVIYLTTDELKRLRDLTFTPEQKEYEHVRDCFLFSCFSGLRHSDVFNLLHSDIKDGNIVITTIKTSDSLQIPLNDITKAILEKYRNEKLPGGKALPAIQNQAANRDIKVICRMAGIDDLMHIVYYRGNERIEEVHPKYELVGTHTGRRTFVVTMLSRGVPASIVMKFTGHSDYNAMKPYIDIVDSAKAEQMAKMNDILK